MNRQIKFRVYSPLGKKFLNSYKNKGLSFLNGSDKDMDEFGSYPLDQCFDLGFIVQQYTGLTDKNGKEIFEGDIVKYKTWTGSYDGTTEQHQTQVQFKDGAYYPRYIDDECEDSWYSSKVYDLEVVGNVFETPHLDENE